MICRKIYRKNPWSFSQWWRSVSSAAAPPLSAVAARSADFEMLSISVGTKGCNFTTQAITDLPIDGVVDVPLAQTGEGIAECELLKWFVHEGDQVEEFQPLREVQSDKATIEITSRYKGKVLKFLHVPGNIVKVGETLLKMIVDENAFSNQCVETLEIMKAPLVSNASELDVVDIGLKKANISGVASTPAVRSFAKQLGVNIEDVHGTGKEGRVLKEDVSSYASNEGIAKEREYKDETITLRGFQRAMVKSMTLAAKIPHFHYVDEINCNALVELKSTFHKEISDPGVKHTFLPVLIKSLSMTLSKYPLLNTPMRNCKR